MTACLSFCVTLADGLFAFVSHGDVPRCLGCFISLVAVTSVLYFFLHGEVFGHVSAAPVDVTCAFWIPLPVSRMAHLFNCFEYTVILLFFCR